MLDQVNAQGGVNRRLIEIRNLDDGYEPDRCAENTRKRLAEEVFALFGHIGTPTSLVAPPLATKDKAPFFAPFTGAMSLRDPFNRHAFHVRASYNDETALIVRQLTGFGLKKIAVFHQNDAYGKAGYGGTFYNVSFVGTQALADELGKDGAGVVVSQVMPSPYNAARPIAREFVDAVKKSGAPDSQANFSSMEGYLAAKVFVEGLRRAGAKPTRDAFIAGLESLSSHSFGGFTVSFSPTDHVASSFVELSMLTGDGRVRT